jgi:hypothetical protein
MNKKYLNWNEDKKLLIERIIEAGLKKDEILMWKYYSFDDIKEVVLNMDELSKNNLDYWSEKIQVNKEEFRCYGTKQWFLRTVEEDFIKLEKDMKRLEKGLHL